jgi:hypothetical protein
MPSPTGSRGAACVRAATARRRRTRPARCAVGRCRGHASSGKRTRPGKGQRTKQTNRRRSQIRWQLAAQLKVNGHKTHTRDAHLRASNKKISSGHHRIGNLALIAPQHPSAQSGARCVALTLSSYLGAVFRILGTSSACLHLSASWRSTAEATSRVRGDEADITGKTRAGGGEQQQQQQRGSGV